MGLLSVRMWEYRFGAVRVNGATTAVWRGTLLQMSMEVPGTGGDCLRFGLAGDEGERRKIREDVAAVE